MKSDNEILTQFFAEARQPIADGGFTARVMQALPHQAESQSIRRINLWLNITAVVASVALATYFGVTALPHFVASYSPALPADNAVGTQDWMQTLFVTVGRIVADMVPMFEDMHVQLFLYLHRLPDTLPSQTQVLALVAVLVILMVNSFYRPQQQSVANK